MNSHLKYNIIVSISILLVACQDFSQSAMSDCKDWCNDFKLFWQSMDRNYVYWDVDTVDWDKKYIYYHPLFHKLEKSSFDHRQTAELYFMNMVKDLVDGHLELTFYQDDIPYLTYNPSLENKESKRSLFSYHVSANYLDKNYHVGIDTVNVKSNNNLVALSGTINGQIVYFYCNYFGLTQSYSTSQNGNIHKVLDHFFSLVQTGNENRKGLIIDVRGNLGGDLVDLNFILGTLIDRPLHFGFSQYKNGLERFAYTSWIEAYVLPPKESSRFEHPIIILADDYSASLSETFVIAIQAMPNGFFIGETTYGATGPILNEHVYMGGSFGVGDFMKVRTSTAKFKSLNNMIYERTGVEPDIRIRNSPEDYISGVDNQLEQAINFFESYFPSIAFDSNTY